MFVFRCKKARLDSSETFYFGVWRRDGRQHGNYHVVGGHRHAGVYRFHVADLHISAPNGCTHGPQRYETRLGRESVTKRDEFSLRVKGRQRRTVAKRAAIFFFSRLPSVLLRSCSRYYQGIAARLAASMLTCESGCITSITRYGCTRDGS